MYVRVREHFGHLASILQDHIKIDGEWSPWSRIQTPCIDKASGVEVVCGGGVRKRYRSCTNPMPQGGGRDCPGISEEEFACNEHHCQLPGKFLWSPWSACSVYCGRGEQKRHTLCGTLRNKTRGLDYSQRPGASEKFRK